ncbi:MAG: hypothetical protein QOI45_817 [Thermoleophilaceae bacterium]|nr:hypothetical protein [Thermoleophilaceae bacterium]
MNEDGARPARGRRLLTALAVATAVAAVPAGVALAGSSGGSDQPSGIEAQSGPDTTGVQNEQGRPDRRDRDHDGRNCPKDRQGRQDQQDRQGQQGSSEQGTSQPDTTQL